MLTYGKRLCKVGVAAHSSGWMRLIKADFVALEKPTRAYRSGGRSGQLARQERNALLRELGHDRDLLICDVEDALHEINKFRMVDQDRVAAIIEHDAVQRWIVDLQPQALLIHGNCRRDERLSPTSAATAMLIRVLSTKMPMVINLYWFCGSRLHGPRSNVLGMLRALVCQILSLSFAFDIEGLDSVDNQNLSDLLILFLTLLRQLPKRTAVTCFLDGISYYEGTQQINDTCEVIGNIAKMVKSKRIIFKFLMTSPTRTSFLLQDSKIWKRVKVVEIPQHIDGPRQGFRGVSVA